MYFWCEYIIIVNMNWVNIKYDVVEVSVKGVIKKNIIVVVVMEGRFNIGVFVLI